MPLSYPLRGDMSGHLCSRCGMVLPRNLYCTNCGYYNASTQATISEQETQPSPAFRALPGDLTSQPTQKLDQYHKQSQSLSSATPFLGIDPDIPFHPSHPIQRPISYEQSVPSATPFLGIGSDGAFSPLQRANSPAPNTSSATPFLGIGSGVTFSPSQRTKSSMQDVSSVTPFLGMTPQSALPQIDFKQSSSNESFYPSSSYSTQPTLIMPAELPKRQKRSAGDSDSKQVSQDKSKKRNLLSGIVISIVVLVIGGLAGYLFMYSPMTQKSTQILTTPSSAQPKEPSEFVDTFKDNRNQWDLRSEAGKYSVAVANGNLVLENNSNSLLPELLPGNRSFTNFKMAVDAVLSKGDQKNGYGLYIRCSSDQDGNPTVYYRFELYGDGTYAIFKGILDKHGRINPSPLTLVNYTTNPAIRKQGDSNHIEVSAKGSTITILVNGQELKTFADPSYTKGTLALFISNVQNTSPGAQAKFSNLVIYPL